MLEAATTKIDIDTRDEGPFWAAEALTEELIGATLTSYEGAEAEAVAKVMRAIEKVGLEATDGFTITRRYPRTGAQNR